VGDDDVVSPISNRCSATMVGHQISDQLHSVGEATLGVASQHFEHMWVVSV
jgi:hypothetical protein